MRFAKIYVEITDVCNLRCSFCPPTGRPPLYMCEADFELYLSRLAPFGDHLYLHVKGEPLLHPSLGDLLAIAARHGFAASVTTNGTLLEEKAGVLLGAANIRKLGISLHSHSGAADVDEYWRGVASFLELHRAVRPFPVSLRLWNRRAGVLPPETKRLWTLLRQRYPAAGEWASAADGARAIKLDEKVFANQADLFAWPELDFPQGAEARGRETNRPSGLRGFCLALRNQVAVLVDGRVVPCCLDGEGAMALGNLRDMELGDILGSVRARAIYDGFSRRTLVEELCRSCGYRRRFDSPEDTPQT